MMRLRVICESSDSAAVVALLDSQAGPVHVTLIPRSWSKPAGDVVEAAIVAEVADDIDHLVAQGVDRRGVTLWFRRHRVRKNHLARSRPSTALS